MNLRHLVLAAIPVVLVACGGAQTLEIQQAAAKTAVAPPPPAASRWDATPWTGAISPEGRPDGLDAGDAGAVYVWHDGDGWHIRTTDQRAVDHHYTGTIRLLPAGESFVDVRPVRDERDDHIFVDGDNVLHYDLHTFASIDGADFHVTCVDRGRGARERLAFHTELDGHPLADRVRIGDRKQSPGSADFAFVRAV